MKKIYLTIIILILQGNVWASQSQLLFNGFYENQELINSQQENNNNEELSCICYGGPGNYRYQCAPVVTICYGGPGNYPYPCSRCQQD